MYTNTDLDHRGEEGEVDVVHDGEEAKEELRDAEDRQEDRQRLMWLVVMRLRTSCTHVTRRMAAAYLPRTWYIQCFNSIKS